VFGDVVPGAVLGDEILLQNSEGRIVGMEVVKRAVVRERSGPVVILVRPSVLG
jgi:hypothetical protein